jgi:hypothetical protein
MTKRTPFQELSNEIQAAIDTGNREALDVLDGQVGAALADGVINLPQAGELTADIELGLSALNRGDDYLDEGFAAIAQGL